MRYIDADKILYTDLSEGRGVCWVTFMDWIKEMPTADVRDNVRGEWQKVDEQPYFRKHFHKVCCSVCRKQGYDYWNYCPNCGADMRGDKA